MKVVFAEPPLYRENYDIEIKPNTDILYTISYLRKKYNNLEIYYIDSAYELNGHLSKINNIEPDIYLLFFGMKTTRVAYKTLNSMKNNFPLLPLICSGSYPTLAPENVLIHSKLDICIVGEAEQTVTELVEYFLKKDKQLGEISGIYYKISGEVVHTAIRPLIKDLDTIPTAAWDLVDFKRFPGPTHLKVQQFKFASINVSRGCPYNCIFCSKSINRLTKPWLRLRSPKNIAQEVECLYSEYGIREIHLSADTFNSIPKWSIKVCEELKKLRHDDLFFSCNLRANNFPDILGKHLSNINCRKVSIGIESGNQRTLDGINKRITLEQVVNTCKSLKENDIEITGFFSIFHIWEEKGELYYESQQDALNTLNFAKFLLSKKLVDFMSWGFIVPIPGTPLYEICLKHNLISKEKIIKMNKWGEIPVKLPGIKEKDMQTLKRKGLLLQMRYNGFGALSDINWKNWQHYLYKIKYIIKG